MADQRLTQLDLIPGLHGPLDELYVVQSGNSKRTNTGLLAQFTLDGTYDSNFAWDGSTLTLQGDLVAQFGRFGFGPSETVSSADIDQDGADWYLQAQNGGLGSTGTTRGGDIYLTPGTGDGDRDGLLQIGRDSGHTYVDIPQGTIRIQSSTTDRVIMKLESSETSGSAINVRGRRGSYQMRIDEGDLAGETLFGWVCKDTVELSGGDVGFWVGDDSGTATPVARNHTWGTGAYSFFSVVASVTKQINAGHTTMRISGDTAGGQTGNILEIGDETQTFLKVGATGGLTATGSSVFDGTVSFQGGGGDNDSTIIGLDHTVWSYNQVIVIGNNNTGGGFESMILGTDNIESDDGSSKNLIIGDQNEVQNNSDENILIGFANDVKWGGRQAIVIGDGAQAGNSTSGTGQQGDDAIAIGSSADADVDYAIAIGQSAAVDGGTFDDIWCTSAIAIGRQASVDDRGEYGIAMGYQSEADAPQSIAIGRSAEIDRHDDASIAIGAYARSTRANQLVFASEFETDFDETIREVAFNDPDDNPLGIRWPNPHYFEGATFNLGRPRNPVQGVSFTSDGATVTVTSVGHGLSTSDVIDVIRSQWRDSVENGEKTITVTGVDTFTFAEVGDALSDTLDYLPPRQTEVTYDGTTGVTSFLNTTASTSATTGALTVAGGLGVAGSIYTTGSVELTADDAGDRFAITRTSGNGPYTISSQTSSNIAVWSVDYKGDAVNMYADQDAVGIASSTGTVTIPDTVSILDNAPNPFLEFRKGGGDLLWDFLRDSDALQLRDAAGNIQMQWDLGLSAGGVTSPNRFRAEASTSSDRPFGINSSEASGSPLTWYGRRDGYSWYADGSGETSGDINGPNDVPFFNVNAPSSPLADILVGIGGLDSAGANVKPAAWDHGSTGNTAFFSVFSDVGKQQVATAATFRISADTLGGQTGNVFEITNNDSSDYLTVSATGAMALGGALTVGGLVDFTDTTAGSSTSKTGHAVDIAGSLGVEGNIQANGMNYIRDGVGETYIPETNAGAVGIVFKTSLLDGVTNNWIIRQDAQTASDPYAFRLQNITTGLDSLKILTDGTTTTTGDWVFAGVVGYSVQAVTTTATVDSSRVRCTGSGYTVTLPASPATGDEHAIRNANATGSITLDGDSTDTIEGATTFTLNAGESVLLTWTGSDWTVF